MRRETWEETGIEVGEVVYHSSQPWPGMNVAKFLFCFLEQSIAHCLDIFLCILLID